MVSVERTFAVSAPPEAVFDYLADFTHTEEWDPGTERTTRTSGDGGVGTTYDNVSSFLGRKVELVYTTAVHERPSTVEFHGRNASATTVDRMTFAASGAGTAVTYRAEFAFSSTVLSVLAPVLLALPLARLAGETVARLEKALGRL